MAVIATFGFTVALLRQPNPVGSEVDALAGTGTWVPYRDPAGAFEVEFPTEPSVSPTDVLSDHRRSTITAAVLRDRFTLEVVDFDDGATGGVYVDQWLDELPAHWAQSTGATVRSAQRMSHAGLPGIEMVLVRDGTTSRVTVLLAGRRQFHFVVTAPTDPAGGAQRFVDSFVPIDPLTGMPVTTEPER